MNYEIIPGKGFEELYIDMLTEDLKALLGEPDEMELLDDEFFEDVDEAIWHYNAFGVYPIVDLEEDCVNAILCDHPELTLGGKKIMAMNPKELQNLLKELGYKNLEIEEDYIECPDAGLNFVFEDNKLDLVDIDIIFE